jgi:3-isopropylmalate dehydrogenase
MLRESFGLETESQWIEAAINRVLEQGYRTADIAEVGSRIAKGSQFTERIRQELRSVGAAGARRSSSA